MKVLTTSRFQAFLLLVLIVLYLVISLRHLEVVPPVFEDEPWLASSGWKLATEGVFGSDLFAGFRGMEEHNFFYMPVHSYLLALIFRIAGLGLFQARLLSVFMGLLVILLTYWLGRRLFGPQVGLLAIYIMLFVRHTGITRTQISGILLLDVVRINRYDILVPVFGLLSLHAYLSGRDRDNPQQVALFTLSGILSGLAGLSNVYGVFWVLVLGLLALWDKRDWRKVLMIIAGFVIVLLPYLGYILNNIVDWSYQVRFFQPRFDLFDPRFYWQNLIQEPSRYGASLGSPSLRYLLRPGFWVLSISIPLSTLYLLKRAHQEKDHAARTLAVPAIVFPILFALLISSKVVSYTATVIPIWFLAIAWGGVSLWKWNYLRTPKPLVRIGVVILVILMSLEGLSRIISLEYTAKTTTPYNSFITQVRANIPSGSSVLGLHNYWFGLSDFDYRSWAVPLYQTDPKYYPDPLSMYEALEQLSPDVILIDPSMRSYITSQSGDDQKPSEIFIWMDIKGYIMTARIDDPTYGPMEIYSIPTRAYGKTE